MLLHLWVLKKIARATVSNTSVTLMSYAIAESKTFNGASSCDSLCLSAFAVGRNVRVTFPVLGLQVQLHQPPAQEKKRLAGDTGVNVGALGGAETIQRPVHPRRIQGRQTTSG